MFAILKMSAMSPVRDKSLMQSNVLQIFRAEASRSPELRRCEARIENRRIAQLEITGIQVFADRAVAASGTTETTTDDRRRWREAVGAIPVEMLMPALCHITACSWCCSPRPPLSYSPVISTYIDVHVNVSIPANTVLHAE